jgi:hypothetical protein
LKSLALFILTLFLAAGIATAQTDTASTTDSSFKRLEFNGYYKILHTCLFNDIGSNWTIDHLIHNRLNFKYHLSRRAFVVLELRTRLFYGESYQLIPGYRDLSVSDDAWVDLDETWWVNKLFFVHTIADRLYANYTKGKWEFTLGRQRINWGQTFVWNPNDIFNSYSFFDIDYEERPGCDALRIQYYRNATSSLELAAKLDGDKQLTAAMLYKFNRFNYDIQLLGGYFDDSDLVAGLGWSGDLFKGGFRAEMSYFHPVKTTDTTGIFSAALGYDYSFKNGLFLRFEGLYNSGAAKNNNFSLNDIYYKPLSAKNLFPAQLAMLGSVSYPLNPFVNLVFSATYSPGLDMLYLGPVLDISVKDNLDFTFVLQSFVANLTDPHPAWVNYFFYRLRLSF